MISLLDPVPIFHRVKSWTFFFNAILTGERTSDIRDTTDRRYKVGDYIRLEEWDPVKGRYTGRFQYVRITYIQTNHSNPCAISDKALADDYAVLSIKLVDNALFPQEQQLNSILLDPIPSSGV